MIRRISFIVGWGAVIASLLITLIAIVECSTSPSGPLFIPVYWPIGYAAPGYVYRPPPVEAPVKDPVEIPVEEPVVVGGRVI